MIKVYAIYWQSLTPCIYPVVCGAPLFPPNSTNTTVSGTTVGAMATFQCEEGLIPSGPTTSTCTDTEIGGQWLPNPADTQCAVSTTTGGDVSLVQIPRPSSLV